MVTKFYEKDNCPNCGETRKIQKITGIGDKPYRTLGTTHFNHMCLKCGCVWMKVKKK